MAAQMINALMREYHENIKYNGKSYADCCELAADVIAGNKPKKPSMAVARDIFAMELYKKIAKLYNAPH